MSAAAPLHVYAALTFMQPEERYYNVLSRSGQAVSIEILRLYQNTAVEMLRSQAAHQKDALSLQAHKKHRLRAGESGGKAL